MKKIRDLALIGALAVILSGCVPLLSGLVSAIGGGGPAPQAVQTASAPLARVTWDESTYRAALATANTTRLTINALITARQITPGSPKALRLAEGLAALRDGLRAARTLLDALNDPVSSLSVAELARKADEYRAAMAAVARAAETIGDALTGTTASGNEGLRIRYMAFQVRLAMAQQSGNPVDAEAAQGSGERLAHDMRGHDIGLITSGADILTR